MCCNQLIDRAYHSVQTMMNDLLDQSPTLHPPPPDQGLHSPSHSGVPLIATAPPTIVPPTVHHPPKDALQVVIVLLDVLQVPPGIEIEVVPAFPIQTNPLSPPRSPEIDAQT